MSLPTARYRVTAPARPPTANATPTPMRNPRLGLFCSSSVIAGEALRALPRRLRRVPSAYPLTHQDPGLLPAAAPILDNKGSGRTRTVWPPTVPTGERPHSPLPATRPPPASRPLPKLPESFHRNRGAHQKQHPIDDNAQQRILPKDVGCDAADHREGQAAGCEGDE